VRHNRADKRITRKAHTAALALAAVLATSGIASAQQSVPVPCPGGPASGLNAQMNPIPCLNETPLPPPPPRNESGGVTSGAPIAPGPPGDAGSKSNALSPGVYSGKGMQPDNKKQDSGVYSGSGMK